MLSLRRVALPACALLFALAACSSAPATSATPSPSVTSAVPSATPTPTPTPTPSVSVPVSDSLDAIKVTGERLVAPKVEFKAPFAIDQTRTKVLEEGKGAAALADGYVTVHYYGINARTGKKFDESYSRKQTSTFSLGEVITGFKTGLTGAKAGSRVLIAIPGTDGYDSAYEMDPSYAPEGYALGDTLLFVVDVIEVSLAQPADKAVTPAAGLPTVTGGPADKPTVSVAGLTAPTTMKTQVLLQGEGSKVTKDSTILARYVGYSFKTGQLVDDQWGTPSAGLLSSTIPGWQTGLLNQQVGSRVLLVLPPKDGFPQGSNNPPLEAGDSIVYVIDLLFAYTS